MLQFIVHVHVFICLAISDTRYQTASITDVRCYKMLFTEIVHWVKNNNIILMSLYNAMILMLVNTANYNDVN